MYAYMYVGTRERVYACIYVEQPTLGRRSCARVCLLFCEALIQRCMQRVHDFFQGHVTLLVDRIEGGTWHETLVGVRVRVSWWYWVTYIKHVCYKSNDREHDSDQKTHHIIVSSVVILVFRNIWRMMMVLPKTAYIIPTRIRIFITSLC
jgi:hypothetical protein